jgi:ferredoxin
MPFRARIDKRSCLSSGRCVEAAPEAFAWDEDDLGDVRPGAPALPKERLLALARNCPGLAISVCDDEGRELDQELNPAAPRSSAPSPAGRSDR